MGAAAKGRKPGDQGQVLVMTTLLMLVLIVSAGLAIDAGRVFVARAQLGRAVDSAALAATLELPDMASAEAKVRAYMAENEPEAGVEVPASPGERQIEVRGTKRVDFVFMRILGIDHMEITASATAGFGVLAVDTVLTIDATGSMGASPCNQGQNNDGCPIKEAKEAAQAFADVLLDDTVGASETLVGVAPYRGCYNPPRHEPHCVPPGYMVADLTANKGLVHGKIQDIRAEGGTGTNVCLGLDKSEEVIFGPDHHTVSNTMRVVVLLSDGDNTYNAASYGEGAPPIECRPTTDPSQSDTYTDTSCRSAQTRERQLDTKTMEMADQLKSEGVEVFVVGFGVCGSPNTNLCDTALVGGASHDNAADRNLLKCLASSTEGTNDHYFEAASAEDLPGIFENIARLIGFRLIK